MLAHHATVKQILGNLIANALKFVAPGRTPEISIWTEELPAGGSGGGASRRLSDSSATGVASAERAGPGASARVRLWVRDNGIGIPPDQHEKIFGLFQRGHTADKYPGTGIGLAIVRKGAERMGGRAGLQSQPGQGSCFWFDLPAASVASPLFHSQAA